MLTYAGGRALLQTMDARDTLPQQRYIYELELSYSFEQTEKEALKVLLLLLLLLLMLLLLLPPVRAALKMPCRWLNLPSRCCRGRRCTS